MGRQATLDRMSEYTQDQHGLITRAQALALAISDQLLEHYLRAGDLERVARGVYRFRRDVPLPDQDIWAAWLQLAPERPAWERDREPVPDAIASHATAAHLYGLGVLFPHPFEFTLTRARRTRRRELRLYVAAVARDEWESLDGLPATRPLRIVTDLLSTHRDPDHVAHAMVDALDRGLVTEADLRGALASFSSELGGPAGDGDYVLGYLREQAAGELRPG